MERLRTAPSPSALALKEETHLQTGLRGWHLVLAKKPAQTVAQAPALLQPSPTDEHGQPQNCTSL